MAGTSYPKIENLSGLGDYADSVMTFAETYTDAVNQTYRNYQVVADDQRGSAIDAFLQKLNTMQEQLFDQYPLAVETYGNTVATYQTALTGLGFNERMWSDTEGAGNLATNYRGSQREAIEATVGQVKSALDKAAAATGTEAPSLESIKSTATEGMSTAATKRTTMATNVNSAWTTFTSTATQNAATISSFQSLMNTAQYISSFPIGDLVKAIKNGDFSADEMYYIDAIQNEDDGKMLDVALGGDPSMLEDINPDNVTENMYTVSAIEMSSWTVKGNEKGIKKANALMDALGQIEQDQSEKFEEGLLYGGDNAADINQQLMLKEYLSNGQNEKTDVMNWYQSREGQYNNFVSFMRTLRAIEFGKETKTVSRDSGQYKRVTTQTGKLSFDKTTGDMEITVVSDSNDSAIKKEVKYSSQLSTSYSGYSSDKIKGNLEEIDKKRVEAKKEFWSSVATDTAKVLAAGATAVATVYAPEVGILMGVCSGLASSNPSASVKALGINDSGAISWLSNIAQDYYQYNKSLDALDKDEFKEAMELKATILNEGGWVLYDGSEKKNIQSVPGTPNFKATLGKYKMDHEGVTGFVDKKGLDIQKYKQELQNSGIDPVVQEYLLGEGLHQDRAEMRVTLDSLTPSQLKELDQGLELLAKAYPEIFGSYAQAGDDAKGAYKNYIGMGA